MTRNLAILIASDDEARLWSALSFACASAVIDNSIAIFFSGAAARLLDKNRIWQADAQHIASGAPTVAQLLAEAYALDIVLSVCQTGMAMSVLTLEHIGWNAQPFGMVGWLGTQCDSEIIVF